ncbi:MAG: hypothetical protein U9P44_04155 [archaeon]|nr:hypothetical protein [archaeon]
MKNLDNTYNFPAIPDYSNKKEIIYTIWQYLSQNPGTSRPAESDTDKVMSETLEINKKKKISSCGIEIIEYASKFIDTQINPEELKEAAAILSKGLKKIEEYENAAMEAGEDTPNKDSYLDLLEKILYNSHTYLQEGFKSNKTDKNFETLINSMADAEETNKARIRVINNFINEIYIDSTMAYRLADFLNKTELNNFYTLPDSEKPKRLDGAGLKIMHPAIEKIGMAPGKVMGSALATLFIGYGTWLDGTINTNTSWLTIIGFCMFIGTPFALIPFAKSSRIIEAEKEFLRKTEMYPLPS